MLEPEFVFINEEFQAEKVSPDGIDTLWADGWRHFGDHFFRYSVGIHDFDVRIVMPLRIRLKDFSLTKSQRRVLNRNRDVTCKFRPINVTPAVNRLFDRHKTRFTSGVPASIIDFLGPSPEAMPVEALELAVFHADVLIAASYLDIGKTAVSGIYGMFEPTAERRSLGTFTLLKEIEFAIERGKDFYYLGYAYKGNSFYDYKKRFRGTEVFDWNGKWMPFKQDCVQESLS